MFTSTRVVKFAGLAAAMALPLTFAACGSSTDSSATPSTGTSSAASSPSMSSSPSASMSPSASSSMTDQPFGAACSKVPASGKGSFDGMSSDPVATAASNNPLLSTLVTAVGKAGLGDTLNNADNITVFAPSNDAFAKIPAKTLKSVLADKKTLTSILTEHVTSPKLTPDTVAGAHQSLNKAQKITVKGSGENFTVSVGGGASAKVLCGNVQTANATVYIIDTVLLPKS
ncbi:fasciclin domain-containing protein [uncultured Friedmanniella sp.]|uniref:fasciclin domain-containing protein n=1 Tax=uncultured Friedmanniella sp. TaxID=335381 RepID=UPI0035CB4E8A